LETQPVLDSPWPHGRQGGTWMS